MPPESGDRVPKGRQPIKDLSSERILALAGVSALLIVGLVILIMIASRRRRRRQAHGSARGRGRDRHAHPDSDRRSRPRHPSR